MDDLSKRRRLADTAPRQDDDVLDDFEWQALLQTIPYDVTLEILDYTVDAYSWGTTPPHCPVWWAVDAESVDLLAHFGYFKRDWTRKIYLVFRRLRVSGESTSRTIVPWTKVRSLDLFAKHLVKFFCQPEVASSLDAALATSLASLPYLTSLHLSTGKPVRDFLAPLYERIRNPRRLKFRRLAMEFGRWLPPTEVRADELPFGLIAKEVMLGFCSLKLGEFPIDDASSDNWPCEKIRIIDSKLDSGSCRLLGERFRGKRFDLHNCDIENDLDVFSLAKAVRLGTEFSLQCEGPALSYLCDTRDLFVGGAGSAAKVRCLYCIKMPRFSHAPVNPRLVSRRLGQALRMLRDAPGVVKLSLFMRGNVTRTNLTEDLACPELEELSLDRFPIIEGIEDLEFMRSADGAAILRHNPHLRRIQWGPMLQEMMFLDAQGVWQVGGDQAEESDGEEDIEVVVEGSD